MTEEEFSRRYSDVIRQLEKSFANCDDQKLWRLKGAVLRACVDCEKYLLQYPHGLDEAESWRRAQNNGRRVALKQRNAVDTLVRFARKHSLQAGVALAAAGFGSRRDTDDGVEIADVFARVLIEYEQHLSKLPWMPSGFLHTNLYYNLLVRKPLGNRRPPSLKPSTGLMLRLVMIFRKYTHGDAAFWRFRSGERMPTFGDPHYTLAAEFARVATGDLIETPQKSLRKFLSANPDVALMSWPTRRNA